MKPVILVCWVLALTGFFNVRSLAATRAETVNNSLLLPDVSRMSDEDAGKAADQFSDHLAALRKDVLAQLKQPNLGNQQKVSLYRLAADLRVYEAMDIMINDIGFIDEQKNNLNPTAALPLGVGGPTAQDMLSTYGLPAFRELLDVMSDRNKNVPFVAANTNAYAWVLWAIEKQPYALIRLQDRLAQEKSPKVQAQYRLVINELKACPNDD